MESSSRERLGRHIKQVEQELTSAKHVALRPFKINVPQYSVLYALLQEPGLSGAVLARRCMVTPQTMSSVLSTLESHALVERKPHPVHSHILEARLTRSGRSLIAKADAAVAEVEQLLTDCFDNAEEKRFLEYLERCSQALAARPAAGTKKASG
ncbi:MarR family transcriptional regulator [Streptomyces sp. ZAF1911]|uniref:MarR family winged helix-turn-helix transcriptional regulator n=1 Tax=unclassified Streptomyces TaxID=2593676 RepID=UPI00202F67DF|nr:MULTISPECIES: MarR family transcriptional regulator [unclassified Streptomyces]MCM1970566.1 MarR family transcriptional regulator [Streptomyces sp. G1]MCX5301756.1 MarR family transcriptional regulator [Streptomyces sp. NBC_00193]MDD9382984.1 MarR family transcriptional regulator [Streptomyces sp. ZAF1911]